MAQPEMKKLRVWIPEFHCHADCYQRFGNEYGQDNVMVTLDHERGQCSRMLLAYDVYVEIGHKRFPLAKRPMFSQLRAEALHKVRMKLGLGGGMLYKP